MADCDGQLFVVSTWALRAVLLLNAVLAEWVWKRARGRRRLMFCIPHYASDSLQSVIIANKTCGAYYSVGSSRVFAWRGALITAPKWFTRNVGSSADKSSRFVFPFPRFADSATGEIRLRFISSFTHVPYSNDSRFCLHQRHKFRSDVPWSRRHIEKGFIIIGIANSSVLENER